MSNAQTIADEVANWSNRNRVKLNTDKCKELRISSVSVSHDFPPVVIGGECIKVVTDAKLFGVTILTDPSWNAHITEVIKKAAKRLCCLIQLKKVRASQRDLCFFLHHICALRYRLCCTCVSLCSAFLLNARTRARSEKVNANHLPWQMEYQHALALTNLPSVAEHHSDICERTFESIFNDSGHTM